MSRLSAHPRRSAPQHQGESKKLSKKLVPKLPLGTPVPALPLGTPYLMGECRVCHCTDEKGCLVGCRWADEWHTICTTCVGLNRGAMRSTAPWCCNQSANSTIVWHPPTQSWLLRPKPSYDVPLLFCPFCGTQLPFTKIPPNHPRTR